MISDSGMSSPAHETYIRKETFLAHYPRKLKLAVTGALLGLIVIAAMSSRLDERLSSLHQNELGEAGKQHRDVFSENRTGASVPSMLSTGDGASSDPEAIAVNDIDDGASRMEQAPQLALAEETSQGNLPIIGENGRKPWQVYARPFHHGDRRPRVAIVVADMGMSRIASDAALRRLHANVTMAFDAQNPSVATWLERARGDGHETLIAVPMEPFDYPNSDPGPNALLTNLPNSHVEQRLNWALGQGTGYVGITTLSGSRFTTDPGKMQVVLDALKKRGLMIFDARVSPHSVVKELAKQDSVPVAQNMLPLDIEPTPAAIDAALRELEQRAHVEGRAVGLATPLPVTLDRLEAWTKQLPSRGIALAPLTAVLE